MTPRNNEPFCNSYQYINSQMPNTEVSELETLKPFLNWVDSAVINTRSSKSEIAFAFGGFVIGVLSTLSTYPLGKGFGKVLARAIKAESVSVGFEVFFGGAALTSTGTLLGMLNKARAREFATNYINKKPQLPAKQDRKKWRLAAKVIEHLFVAFAGTPFYFLLKNNVYDTALPWTTILGSWVACYSAANEMIENIFNIYANETQDVTVARVNLNTNLDKAILNLQTMSDENILIFYNEFTQQNTQNNPDLTTLKKLNKIMPQEVKENNEEVKEVVIDIHVDPEFPSKSRNWKKGLLDLTSGVVALLSTYVLISCANETAKEWADKIGGGAEVEEAISTSIVILGITANSAFNVIYTHFKTDRIYQAIKTGDYKPSLQAVVAQGVAVCSSIPNTYMAIDSAHNIFGYLLIAPSFLSPALAQSLGFEALLNEGINFYRNTFQKDTPLTKRNKLLMILQKLKEALVALDHTQLLLLDHALQAHQSLLASPTESEKISEISHSIKEELNIAPRPVL